jgi:hypothetical protein
MLRRPSDRSGLSPDEHFLVVRVEDPVQREGGGDQPGQINAAMTHQFHGPSHTLLSPGKQRRDDFSDRPVLPRRTPTGGPTCRSRRQDSRVTSRPDHPEDVLERLPGAECLGGGIHTADH